MMGAANASIIDLSGFSNGETFDTGDVAGLTVTTDTDGGGAANDFAFILDTNNPGSDGDLASPFDDPSTVGDEDFMPGNVLALAQDACGMGFCPVNDNGSGGVMTWTFDRDVAFNSFDVFDFKTGELKIELFDELDQLVFSAMVPTFNTDTGNNVTDNLFTTIDIGGVISAARSSTLTALAPSARSMSRKCQSGRLAASAFRPCRPRFRQPPAQVSLKDKHT